MTIKPFLYAILLLNLLVLVSCNFSQPIKLGYVATLSGRYTEEHLASMEEVAASSQALANLAEEMQSAVRHFQI
ncbi:hypothetical protein SPSIL_049820 [Sporomusa silvacetica DSM 10669]|uniref:Uncharacterized protein n=1 Tax=Sporomusa silvacetica DSM 10669 TaxID=1123289 RepID=A0ABZ3ITM4_9FIRM|nr:hypothetical protein SPSIL_41620 [Sporomusa silvacetica DSM 10669]